MRTDDASSRLTEILVEFSEAAGGPPSLKEFLQLLEWSSGGLYSAPFAFEVTMADGTIYSGPEGSRVPELRDSTFTDVSDILAGLRGDGAGSLASPSDLADILLTFVHGESANLLDVFGRDVSRISIAATGDFAEPKVGDILAIPDNHAWHAAIVVARNRFGVALGIFREKFNSPISLHPQSSSAYQFPVYTDCAQVLNGSWKVVGHDESLLSGFPAEPEIYHPPGQVWPVSDFGEFGAAETPSGNIRLIGNFEARAVGILDGSYRQSYTSEFLQQSLGSFMRH